MKSRILTKRRVFESLAVLCLALALEAGAYEIQADNRKVSARQPVDISAYQLLFDRLRGLTLFKGKVKAVHDKVTLHSDEMRALSGNREATATGHVTVTDSSQAMTLTCGNLEYQDLMNTMTAHDHPLLTALDEKGRPISVLGRQMELDSEKKTVVIHQNVQILHGQGKAEAQMATFLSKQDKLVLEEDPKVYTDNAILSGRRIVTTVGQDKSVLVEGMADAVFNPAGKPVAAPSAARTPSGPGAAATGTPVTGAFPGGPPAASAPTAPPGTPAPSPNGPDGSDPNTPFPGPGR